MVERAEARPDTQQPTPLWRRLAWFIGLWAAGVATLGLVAAGWRMLVGWLS